MVNKKLPPLPGSDEDTLKRNYKDGFYGKRPSDVWSGFVEHKDITDPPECDHSFVEVEDGVRCEKCNVGWIGKQLRAKDGHVFLGDQKLY